MATITARGVGVRFLVAFALVALTWNPTRINYVAWALARWSDLMPLVVFVGLVLAIAWIFFLRATTRSLGGLGIILACGLAATLVWILLFYHVVERSDIVLLHWIGLVLLAAVLAAGMSWSHLRRSWAGQADVDDIDQR